MEICFDCYRAFPRVCLKAAELIRNASESFLTTLVLQILLYMPHIGIQFQISTCSWPDFCILTEDRGFRYKLSQ